MDLLRRRRIWRSLVPLSLFTCALFFSACTRTSTASIPDRSGTESTGTNTFGGSSNAGGGTTSNMSNLFNNDLDDQEKKGNAQAKSNSLTSNAQTCLVNGFNSSQSYYDDEYQGTGLNNAGGCLSSKSEPVDAQNFYSSGLQALGGMETCLQMAMTLAPQSDQDAQAANQLGEIVMFRCFRNLAGGMQNAIPWSNEQNQVYGNYIQNMNGMIRQAHQGQF